MEIHESLEEQLLILQECFDKKRRKRQIRIFGTLASEFRVPDVRNYEIYSDALMKLTIHLNPVVLRWSSQFRLRP